MRFKDWLKDNDTPFWEMIDIAKVDVSDVELEVGGEFDEEEAIGECEREIYDWFDESEYFSNIYDDPSDDPEFDTPTVEDWEDDNPMPERDGYDSDDAFESAVEDWHSDRTEASSDYDHAVERWERDMRSERIYAQERADEARDEALDECVESKRREGGPEFGSYKHSFDIDGKQFTVTMTKEQFKLGDMRVDNVFDILFEGPRGVQLTGIAGTAATKIYGEMLKGIKKLTEIEDVKGFAFVPAHPSMRLMYERFYQQFMKPKYIRVDEAHYIRSDIVKLAKERSSESVKKGMIGSMSQAHQKQKKDLRTVARMKEESRSFIRRRNELIGMFVPTFNANYPIFIWDIQPSGKVLYTEQTWDHAKDGIAESGEPAMRRIAVPASKMPKISSQDEMNRFVESLKYDESDYPGIVEILNYFYVSKPNISSFGSQVRDMIQRYKSGSVESSEGFMKLAARYPEAKKRLDEAAGVGHASPAGTSPEPIPSAAGSGNPYIKSNTFDT